MRPLIPVGDASIDAPALTGLNPMDAVKSYVSQTEDICSVDELTGEVSDEGEEGTCTIRLTLTKTGYNDTVHDYSFDIGMTLGRI